jgi:hypothetical protein
MHVHNVINCAMVYIFSQVIPRELLSFFTADEFSLLMNGVSKIDVNDWKENTQVRNNY